MAIKLSEAWKIPEHTGGKAVRLSVMQNAGFPIKDGVVVTTEEVDAILTTGQVPQGILSAIKGGLTFPVAVRSSGAGKQGDLTKGEDGKLAWAGQFATKLFVYPDDLEKTILECALAVRSDAVRAYAKTHGIEIPSLALLIEEMVIAETAGVLFTRHPVDGRFLIVIEAVEGVGEALVSGKREPRRVYADPLSGEIIDAEGAVTPVLSQQQVKKLANLAKEARRIFGNEQDIEWAIEQGTSKVFLLQARDITTLSKGEIGIHADLITAARSVLDYEMERLRNFGIDITEDVLSDQNIAELITPHPSKMAFGLFTYLFAHGQGAIRTARNEMGYEIGPELDVGFFHLVGGQPRCSIIHDAFTYRIRGIPLEDYAYITQYYINCIKQDPSLANYPEIVLYKQNPSLEFLEEMYGKSKARQYRRAYDRFFKNLTEFEDTLWRLCREDFLKKWRRVIERRRQREIHELFELCLQYEDIARIMRFQACNMFVKAARIGFFAYADLRSKLTELFGEEGKEYADILTAGIPLEDNPVLRFGVELAQARDGIRSEREVLKKFGHLATHEMEISVPRYHEIPKALVDLVHKIGEDPSRALNDSMEKAQELREKLLQDAGSARDELGRVIDLARTYLPLRELVKFEFLRGYDALREIALRTERLLDWDKGAIFHLYPQELFVLYKDPRRFSEAVAERQWQYREEQKIYVPPVIFSSRLQDIGRAAGLKHGTIFTGIGVTNKTAEGKVVLVKSLDDKEGIASLEAGAVLVTVTTDPAWTPLLSIIGPNGGLVTEVGGLLAHGAIYAREIGIAAVLNIPEITKILKTGMKIRVNGRDGYVEVLE